MDKLNLLMFHRIKINNNQDINDLYFKRNMVHSVNNLFDIIENLLDHGFKFGTISQSLPSNKYFHLTFDDGFKEHLDVAFLLKEKYNIKNKYVTFSINISNSFYNQYTGMDIVYEIIKRGEKNKLCNFLGINENSDIEYIKQVIAKKEPSVLIKISSDFKLVHRDLRNTFLNQEEVIKLSKLFQIASHGITHRFLTYNKNNSRKEIIQSKEIIEKIINKSIDVFCYPEGKNDNDIQQFCMEAGYKYALSIRHEKDNKFCIGRIII